MHCALSIIFGQPQGWYSKFNNQQSMGTEQAEFTFCHKTSLSMLGKYQPSYPTSRHLIQKQMGKMILPPPHHYRILVSLTQQTLIFIYISIEVFFECLLDVNNVLAQDTSQ